MTRYTPPQQSERLYWQILAIHARMNEVPTSELYGCLTELYAEYWRVAQQELSYLGNNAFKSNIYL